MRYLHELPRYGLVIVFAFISGVHVLGDAAVRAVQSRKTLDCVTVAKPPKVDGKLDDACWNKAARTSPFVSGGGTKAPQTAVAFICQDEDNLYVGFRFSSPGGPYKSKAIGRDTGRAWAEESVEIFLDVDHDHKDYYQIMMNSSEALDDVYYGDTCLTYDEANFGDSTWRAPIEGKAFLGTNEWTGELRIPFSGFTRSDKITSTIGINISRGDMTATADSRWMKKGRYVPSRAKRDYFWIPVEGGHPHRPHKFAHLKGLTGKWVTAVDSPYFVQEPEVTLKSGKARIRFEVNACTDVTVGIKDGKGKTVRHLASGVLGKNTPNPFKAMSVAQELYWDLKDDAGNRVPAGEYRVNVGLGLSAKLERIIGESNFGSGLITAATIGRSGDIYLLHGNTSIRSDPPRMEVYQRDGSYARTIIPVPADVPKGKLHPIITTLRTGEQIPLSIVKQGSFLPYFDVAQIHTMAMMGEDRLIMCGRAYDQGDWRLVSINKDGSIPSAYWGPKLWQNMNHGLYLACDSERGYVYLAALSRGYGGSFDGYQAKWKAKNERMPVVFRTRMLPDAKLESFIGRPETQGSKETHINNPISVAVGKDGKVYVGDSGNSEVAVFSREGKFLKAFPVNNPEYIAVDRKTDELYVLSTSYDKQTPTRLLLISPSGKTTECASYACGGGRSLLLDDHAEKPIVWVLGRMGVHSYTNVNGKLEERRLSDKAAILQQDRPSMYMFVAVDPETDHVYTLRRVHRMPPGTAYLLCFDGKTGKPIPVDIEPKIGFDGIQVSRDRLLYLKAGGLYRYDLKDNLKPVPFTNRVLDETAKKRKLPPHFLPLLRSHYLSRGGFTVAPNGDIYVFQGGSRMIGSEDYGQINIYGPDGAPKKQAVVRACAGGSSGIQVDRQGNIYIGESVKSRGRFYPEAFTARDGVQGVDGLPRYPPSMLSDKRQRTGAGDMMRNRYLKMYGTIIKFPASGGGV